MDTGFKSTLPIRDSITRPIDTMLSEWLYCEAAKCIPHHVVTNQGYFAPCAFVKAFQPNPQVGHHFF